MCAQVDFRFIKTKLRTVVRAHGFINLNIFCACHFWLLCARIPSMDHTHCFINDPWILLYAPTPPTEAG